MKSIFLVNSISGRGHLDSYARLYSRAFLDLGCQVTLLADTDGGTSDFLARSSPDHASFSFVSFADTAAFEAAERLAAAARAAASGTHIASRAHLGTKDRALHVWKEEGFTGILRRGIVVPRRIANRLVPEAVRDGRRKLALTVKEQLVKFAAIRALRRFFFPNAGRILFATLTQHVQNAIAMKGGRSPDLVFFLYLDLMAEGAADVATLGAIPGWAGILFHPRLRDSQDAGVERYFQSSSAKGAVFLVPDATEIYEAIAPGRKFLFVPDVADLEQAAELPAVAQEIRRRAAGRTIILQVGTIARHKGTMTLIDVIAKADPQRFFFAMIGEVYWQSFAGDEPRLRSFYAQPPENVVTYDGYMADERDYNSLVAACDVIYAVYSGFNSSSNSLTKAAGLQRPILAAQDSLMGERVVAHRIGLAVPSNDADEILAALQRLANGKPGDFDFRSYADQHSLEELKSVLAKGLQVWSAGP